MIETAPGVQTWMNLEQIRAISAKQHVAGKCGGFMDVTDEPGAGRTFVTPILDFEHRTLKQGAILGTMLPELSADQIVKNVEALAAFHNRYYDSETGVAAANWLADQFRAMAKDRTDVMVELVPHTGFSQPSVRATIHGTTKAGERIVLGAHLDSINWKADEQLTSRAPGADDDGSGIATVLEAFRVIAQSGFQPERTIEFYGYAGEEMGLLGSKQIARQYRTDRMKIAAVLQLDMTMYPGTPHKIELINDYVYEGLTGFTGKLIEEYVKAPYEASPCGYACSDHASWDRYGYAAAFPFEAPMGEDNPNIHSEDDVLSILDASFGLHFAKIAVAFAAELSRD